MFLLFGFFGNTNPAQYCCGMVIRHFGHVLIFSQDDKPLARFKAWWSAVGL